MYILLSLRGVGHEERAPRGKQSVHNTRIRLHRAMIRLCKALTRLCKAVRVARSNVDSCKNGNGKNKFMCFTCCFVGMFPPQNVLQAVKTHPKIVPDNSKHVPTMLQRHSKHIPNNFQTCPTNLTQASPKCDEILTYPNPQRSRSIQKKS